MTTTAPTPVASEADQLGAAAFRAALDAVAAVSPEIARHIGQELTDQRRYLKLIASENYSSLAVQAAMGNLLTDKYAEGVPGHRFYAGCDNVDAIETYAASRAKQLFGADHAYVQPHSGADANMVAFWAILTQRVEVPALDELGIKSVMAASDEQWAGLREKLGNQRLLGMDLASGGHLTHGYRLNVSGKMFDAQTYAVSKETMRLDYDAIEKQAEDFKPLILLAGYSAYPRPVDFKRMRAIADKVGAVLMVDMAHFAGLVAGKVFTGDFDPVPHAHVVTSTTHKTLRGPRGGIVMCTDEFADAVNKGCPLVLGGPLGHVMAAKAVAFDEALRPEFRGYAARVVENSAAMARGFIDAGGAVTTGGTENHLFVLDVRPYGLTGRQAEPLLRECGITLNRNAIPFDPNGAWYTSGLRFGTAAVTTRGMGPDEMREIAAIATEALSAAEPTPTESGNTKAKYKVDADVVAACRQRVETLLDAFPLYPGVELPSL